MGFKGKVVFDTSKADGQFKKVEKSSTSPLALLSSPPPTEQTALDVQLKKDGKQCEVAFSSPRSPPPHPSPSLEETLP